MEPAPSVQELKSRPKPPILPGMSDRERDLSPPAKRAKRGEPRPLPPTSISLDSIGCEPADACLDGEAPLSRDPTDP